MAPRPVLKLKPPPPAPLLRQPRRSGRLIVSGIGLLLAGLACGLVLGLTLPPTIPPATPQPSSQAERVEPRPARAPERGELQAEAEALRQAIAAERARLDSVTQARMAAEAQLATLQREVAALAARREAPAPAPVAAAIAPAPRPPRAEPPAGPAQPRVVLHHRAGSPAAMEAAQAAAGSVREAGFAVDEVRMATAVPSQRVVRYFHSEDATAAARLAGRLGRGWAIQDFRTYEPSPSPGTLEVWLPER